MAAIATSASITHTGYGTDTYAKAGVATYTDGARPSASALFAKLIYNSSQGKHQISDGTDWFTFLLDWPYAAAQPLASYTAASRPSALSNPRLFIWNATTSKIERSDGLNWIVLGSNIDEAAEAVLGVGPDSPVGKAAPPRVTPPTAATKVYIDPTGSAGSGSLASPRNSLPGPLVAGTEYLVRQGTTLGGAIALSVGGSSTSRVILGVYNPANGARVSAPAAATLSGGVSITGAWSVLDGFAITGGTQRIEMTNVADVTILNCRANNASDNGIKGYNCNRITIDGCEARFNRKCGIKFGTPGGTVNSGLQIQYSKLNDNKDEAGFAWYGDADTALLATSEIVRCEVSYNDNREGLASGDAWSSAGITTSGNIRSLRIYRNTLLRNAYSNIRCFGYTVAPEPPDALIIENNSCLGSSMSIHMTNMQGKWVVRRNKIVDAGTNDDGKINRANYHHGYGRGIELFCDPKTAAKRTSDGVICMNAIYGSVSWDAYMTEGCGLGFDDWTGYCTAFGNWVAHNEGSGVQYNYNTGSVALGNVFYDNLRRPTSNRILIGDADNDGDVDGNPAFAMRSEIGGSGFDCLTIGNVIVGNRELDSAQGGLSDYGGQRFEWTYNLVVNVRIGANSSSVNGAGNNNLRAHNTYVNCGVAVAASYDQYMPAAVAGSLATGETATASAAGPTASANAAASALTMLMSLPWSGTVVAGIDTGGGTVTPPVTPPTSSSTPVATFGTPAKTPQGSTGTSLAVPVPAGNAGDEQGVVVILRSPTPGVTAPTPTGPAGWTPLGPFTHSVALGVVYAWRRSLSAAVIAEPVTVTFAAAVAAGIGHNVADAAGGVIVKSERPDWSPGGIAPSAPVATANSLWLQYVAPTDSPRTAPAPSGVTAGASTYVDNGTVGLALMVGTAPAQPTETGVSGEWTFDDPYGGADYERPIELSWVFAPAPPTSTGGGGGGGTDSGTGVIVDGGGTGGAVSPTLSSDISMRVIAPNAITDAVLVSSTVAETDYPEWAAVTTYSVGDRVIRLSTHRIYEAVVAGVNAGTPETTPTRWVMVGSTNRWRMLDEQVGSATTTAGPLKVVLKPGFANSLALLELKASAVTVTVRSSEGGPIVYTDTRTLDDAPLSDWYEYFFSDPIPRTEAVWLGLPIAAGYTLEVTLEGGTVECGALVVGVASALGLPQYGATLGIIDYSRKETNEFGSTFITRRAWAKRLTARVQTPKADFNRVYRTLAGLRSTPCVWVTTGVAQLEAMTVYGYFRDFRIDVAYPEHVYCSLEIEGLI